MPHANADGVRLYYEEAGEGAPLLFVHEFGGDLRSWEPQLRFFARRYRCIAYNARGYPPSDVPDDPDDYNQARQADDVTAMLDHLGIESAHVVGLSMGAFAALHFGLRHPVRARALVLGGIGSGAVKGPSRETFRGDSRQAAGLFLEQGSAHMAELMMAGLARRQLRDKDPRGWAEAKAGLAGHSAEGAARTLLGYQAERPSLYDLEAELRRLDRPVLVLAGDEDEPCLDASLWLKRVLPAAGLWIAPRTGHCVNLEEPAAFNRAVLDFLTLVEQGRWRPRAVSGEGSFGALETAEG